MFLLQPTAKRLLIARGGRDSSRCFGTVWPCKGQAPLGPQHADIIGGRPSRAVVSTCGDLNDDLWARDCKIALRQARAHSSVYFCTQRASPIINV